MKRGAVATTENVTVLFTDLVGSTELASSLTPEAGDELRRRHFSALRQAIAESGGTEVKNLGDGLMVVYPAASSALSCAVAMQQAVDRDNADAERPLGLRVGLSAGEATREANDYFGDPIVEAARLCARAEAGQILASDLVRANAGRRTPHAFSSLGELSLKGLPDPVQTLEVSWEPLEAGALTAGTVPLPTRLVHRPGVGVIGREHELALLEAAAKRVASGAGREVVLVAGEPGQGKTTLVAEIARQCHEAGMTVLLGRCDEEVGSPYRPFHEALTHYVAHADESLLRSHVAAHGPELARLVPALHQRLGELPPRQATDADTERYLLYAAAVGLLEKASGQSPVVLVLDDLHWVDKPSLQLLRHIVVNTSSASLLILGTYRDGELSAGHPLTEGLAALHREPAGVSSIHLKGLDDLGVLAYMESAAGHELDGAGVALAHDLYRETDGNPFFVAEVLRSLSESGVIVQDATGRWTAANSEGPLALPNSVRAVIGTRVSRLGEEAARALSAASVIGRDFDFDLLVSVTSMDEDELIDLLDQAHSAALVNELPDSPGRYSFSHALVQHTLYEDMGATRRTRMHHAVGEAIERLYGGTDERVGELAHHFLLATRPTDIDKAVAYAHRAGEAALAALAPDDAVRYFSQALEFASGTAAVEPTLRVDLLIGLGRAQRQTGDPACRDTLLDAARRAADLEDTDRLVAAALANNRGFFSNVGAIDADKIEVLEMALARLRAASADRALVLATLCSELAQGSPLARRQALADEAISIAVSLDDDAILVPVLNSIYLSLEVPSQHERSLERSADALVRAERLGDLTLMAPALDHRCQSAARAGDVDELDRCHAILEALAEQLKDPTWIWVSSFWRATRAQIAGDTDQAEEFATQALKVGTDGGHPDATSFWGTQLVVANHQRGTMGEFVPLLEQLAAEAAGISGVFTAALARAYAESDRIAQARDLLAEFSGSGFEFPMEQIWLTGMVCYAEAAISVDDPEYAGPLFELLAPWHTQLAGTAISNSGPVSTYLGGLATVLGCYDEAATYFEHSAAVSDRIGAKFFAARTALWWGSMLAKRQGAGDAEEAKERLTRARTLATGNGYGAVKRRAAAALLALDT